MHLEPSWLLSEPLLDTLVLVGILEIAWKYQRAKQPSPGSGVGAGEEGWEQSLFQRNLQKKGASRVNISLALNSWDGYERESLLG